MIDPQHTDALGLKFAKVYTVTKQNPPSNIFDSRFKRSPMGAEQSRSATQRKPRRASTGETNVLIPPPPNIKISSVLEIGVVLFRLGVLKRRFKSQMFLQEISTHFTDVEHISMY